MEYHSWLDKGVPEVKAWEMDEEVVVLHTTQGKLRFGLFHVAAPQAVATFKKGIRENLYNNCKMSRGNQYYVQFSCEPSPQTKLPNLPVEWLYVGGNFILIQSHAPLEGRVGMEPVSKDSFEVSPYQFKISLHEENADLMAPGGETKAGYSIFMKLLDSVSQVRRFARQNNQPVTLSLEKQ